MYVYESQYGYEVEAMTSDPRKYKAAAAWVAPTFNTKMEAHKWMFDAQLTLRNLDDESNEYEVRDALKKAGLPVRG